ncbi:hypothetical protein C2S51_022281 [Perilla frutescens var. frutescens]|nr:hypothetical protein C2S51_022281 [Perilla frutescens var. frutescens]
MHGHPIFKRVHGFSEPAFETSHKGDTEMLKKQSASATALPTRHTMVPAMALSICGQALRAQPHLKTKSSSTQVTKTVKRSPLEDSQCNQGHAVARTSYISCRDLILCITDDHTRMCIFSNMTLRTCLFQTTVTGMRMIEWPVTHVAENDGERTNESTTEAKALKKAVVKCARAPKVVATLKRDGVKHARALEVAAAPDFMVLMHVFEKYSMSTEELTYYGDLLANFFLSFELVGLISLSDMGLQHCVVYLKWRVGIFSSGKIMRQIWDYF